ncbi:hypothetical protein GBAR_LOCUS26746, partial [Geodia barretti]
MCPQLPWLEPSSLNVTEEECPAARPLFSVSTKVQRSARACALLLRAVWSSLGGGRWSSPLPPTFSPRNKTPPSTRKECCCSCQLFVREVAPQFSVLSSPVSST